MRSRDLGRNVPNQYGGYNRLRHVYLPLALACVDARFTVIWFNNLKKNKFYLRKKYSIYFV